MTKGLCSLTAAIALLTGCAGSPECCEPEVAALKSHFAKFGTNKVHYVVEGKGSHTVVLIHGWSGNLDVWREQIPALIDKARVIRIDLPGHGRSDKPNAAYTMDFFADSVVAVLRDAGVKKATLAGHSMGVPVICSVYRKAPDRVAGLVAVDGPLYRPAISSEQAERFISAYRSDDYRESVRRFISSMFPEAGTETIRDRLVADALETPQHVMVSAMEGMFMADKPDWKIQPTVPVLILNAPNPMWNDQYRNYVRGLSLQLDYRSMTGVGHWLMLEKPAEFNSLLLEMLSRFELIDK